MYELYLAHWGIKGQRWGFRRFQNQDGTLTAAGKQRYKGAQSSPRHQASEARKKAKAEEDARKFEEKRQKALRTGNATEVLKYKNYSTRQELQDAYNRISTERLLSSISEQEKASGKKVVDKVLDTATVWKDRTEKGIGIWNTIAKVHNSFVDEDDAWQKIGDKSVTQERRERAEKREKEEKEKAEKDLEKMNKDARDKLIADYAKKYGDYNEVKNNIGKMTLKDARKALERFEPEKVDEKTESKRQKLIREYITRFGSSKRFESYIDSLSAEEIEQRMKIEEEKLKKEKKKDDD